MSITERTRCLLLNNGLSKGFWTEAVNMDDYLINMSPKASLVGKVEENVWTCNPIDLENLKKNCVSSLCAHI